MTTDNLCFYLQNRLIQNSQTGGQWYSDTSPFSIPCAESHYAECCYTECRSAFPLDLIDQFIGHLQGKVAIHKITYDHFKSKTALVEEADKVCS